MGFNALSDVTLNAGTTMYIPLNSTDSGQTVNYAVTASDYSKLTPTIMPSSNKTLQLNVLVNGVAETMDFQLFDNMAPNTTAQIEQLVNSGFYNGLQIYRNGKDGSGNPFVIQGGNDPPTGAIKTDQSSMAEEFNPDLQYTSAGMLAMARSGTPGSSSTEFFVTEEAARFLDYNYTIFGFQTTGTSVDQAIAAMADESSTQDPNGLGYLVTPLTITSASIITDTQNGVLELQAPAGATGTFTVTVTASDGTNTPTSHTFNVTLQADSSSNPANPFASVVPATPTGLTYLPPSGASSQFTNLNNSSGKTLQFQVSGFTSGNTVEVLADGNVIGQVKNATGSTVVVTTDGSKKLTDGAHTFTAIQVAPNQTVTVNESDSSSQSGTTAESKTANAPSLDSAAVSLTVDTVAPTIATVSSTQPTGAYKAGTTISITVTFSEAVIVTGTPQLSLNAGTGAVATYTGGSGTSALTFTYTVAAGQNSADLDYASTAALALNGGTIQDAASNAATLTLPATGTDGLAAQKIVVDTTPPTVAGISSTQATGAYGAGTAIPITITFSEPVTVTGTPQLTLNASSAAVATYTSGSGTATLTFTYNVAAGDYIADLDYTSTTALALNGGSIQDAAANPATLTLPATGADGLASKNIVIATTVTGVSSTKATGAYKAGTAIPITITFSEPVTVTGTPQLALNTGSGAVATYVSGSSTSTLTFTYTVATGDNSSDLDYASATALALKGGTILDTAGHAAVLTLPTTGTDGLATQNIVVDTTPPTVAGVSSTQATGAYGAGTPIPITITFSEPVTVDVTGGTPQLTLNASSGAVATYTSGSGTSTLTFTYTVAAGDYIADLDYTSTAALALNGGIIQDAATNPATLTLPATGTDGLASKNLVIATTVTGVSSTTTTGAYKAGTAIPITITFSEPVTVDVTGGTPQLTLNASSGAVATYVSGSSTSTLTFTYTVATGDNSSDLDYASATALALKGGTILDTAGHAAVLTLPTTGTDGLATQNIVVDTTPPTVAGVSSTQATGAYGAGTPIPITITFSEPVTVDVTGGTPQLTLNAGSGAVATYTSGSGTATLTFTYTVAAGQYSSDLDYTSTTALTLNGGSIQDAAGNAATLTLPTIGTDGLATQNIVIAPTVTGVSSTKATGTYGVGTAAIPITLTFSGPVTVTGTPQLTLNAGSGVVATYTGGSGTSTLTFTYTVAVGNNASDLDYASTTALALNGGSIEDAAGHAAILTLPTIGTDGLATRNIKIDTTPTVNVTEAGGTYNGSAFSATATVAGINGSASSTLEGVSPTLLYYTGSSATGTGSATAPTAAGTYTVVASFAGSQSYTAAKSQAVTFTITPAQLTITADSKINPKGAPLPTLTFTSTGLVGSDTLTTQPTLSTTATTSSALGTYAITISGAAASSNYTITYVNGTLTVIGADTIGGYDSASSRFLLSSTNSSGMANTNLLYGVPGIGLIPLYGDWNGDGVETIGLYDPATSDFYLRNSNSSGMADTVVCFGAAGSGFTPIVGDWTGDGVATVGLYDPTHSVFYLRDSNTTGMADTVVVYGAAGSGFTPIIGDWTGGGTDTVGLYDPTNSVFYLRDSNTTGFADTTFTYAPATGTAIPVAGDWNGNGHDTVGLYYPATSMFYLSNGNATADATSASFMYGPANTSGWTPLVGHWSGDGQASPTWVSSTQTSGTYKAGTAIPITVTFSAPVTVTGTPQLSLNAGSNVVADYTSGSGTSTLNFTYTVAGGDKTADLDYASTTALTLNGGTIDDATGNAAVLTLPATGTDGLATQNIAIDTQAPSGYSITADQSAIGPSDATAASFTFAGAEVGATYNYTVTSNGGTGSVTGTGTITSATQQVKGVNVSSLSGGTLIYTVTLTDPAGNAGSAVTATAAFDKTAPSGYTITADQSTINASDDTAASFTFAGAETGATYNYTVTSSGGTGSVTGTGTITSATQQVTGINVSTLADGTLTYSVTLTDAAGNVGSAKTATATMDTKAPTGYSITADQSTIDASNATAASFTFAGAEAGATYNYTVTSSGGTGSVTGTGTITSATQQVTGINVSTLPDGTLTYSVTLTDAAGNTGSAKTATATLQQAQVQAAVDAAMSQSDDWLSA